MKANPYADSTIDYIYIYPSGRGKYWRNSVPKGVKLYRRRARRHEEYDRGVFVIKSKGRTGAVVRARMMARHGEEILLDRKLRPF